jgi:hypothetical protein
MSNYLPIRLTKHHLSVETNNRGDEAAAALVEGLQINAIRTRIQIHQYLPRRRLVLEEEEVTHSVGNHKPLLKMVSRRWSQSLQSNIGTILQDPPDKRNSMNNLDSPDRHLQPTNNPQRCFSGPSTTMPLETLAQDPQVPSILRDNMVIICSSNIRTSPPRAL